MDALKPKVKTWSLAQLHYLLIWQLVSALPLSGLTLGATVTALGIALAALKSPLFVLPLCCIAI